MLTQFEDHCFRIMLLGCGNVGKSELLLKYDSNDVNVSYKSQLQKIQPFGDLSPIIYKNKTIDKEKELITFQLWDITQFSSLTMNSSKRKLSISSDDTNFTLSQPFQFEEFGQHQLTESSKELVTQIFQKYQKIRENIAKDTDGFLIVFDITDRQSYQAVENIYWNILKVNSNEKVVKQIVLVGNKTDLDIQRTVSEGEAKKLALKLGVQYIQTSTSRRQTVINAFKMLENTILEQNIKERPKEKGLFSMF